MRALVLGGSGHVGNAVVRELLGSGASVTAASRAGEAGPNLRGLSVALIGCDTDDTAAIDDCVAGHDLVVDAAAPYRLESLLAPGAGGSPVAAARRRAADLVASAERHGARLAHVGSFATRPAQRDPLDELQALCARWLHPYFRVKEVMEEVVLEAGARGVPALVVNPTYCLGPWDQKPPETCFVPQVVRGRLPGAVTHQVNVVDVRDVARALVKADAEERFGEAVVVSGHDVTVSSLMTRVLELSGGEPPRLRAPAWLGALAAGWADLWMAAGGGPTSEAWLAALLVLQQAPRPPGRAQRELGVAPRALSVTLADALAWYREIGYC